jgi:DNA-binding SARP family transcriptional activator/tetratricopeptide (TPR) repeat protein
MAAELRLRLFGRPQAWRDGSEVRFDTRKALALLALLAVTGREHSRDALAAMLWPDLDRARARATLRRTLSVATAVGSALEITTAGVLLDPEGVACDVREFQALAAGSDPGDWEQAVDLAAEGFLDGFALRDSPAFEDWQFATADVLRSQLSQTLARLVAASVARGDLDTALGFARRRITIDPLSEPAHADAIRVAAWSGDRSGALQAYRALVRLLDRELGVPPLPATLALHEAIRGDTLDPPPAGGLPPVETPAPPVAPPERFVGREPELTLLRTAWQTVPRGGRCVGLVGDPGIGKSALLRALSADVTATGAAVLQLTGHAAESPLAYGAANDLVRAMLALRPQLPAELGDRGAPLGAIATEFAVATAPGIRSPGDLQRLHEAVRVALESLVADNALLLTVDDAHLLDAPSAALLGYVIRRMPDRLLIAATWTSGSGGAPLPEAVTESGQVLVVPSLDLAGVAALLEGTPHDPAEVLRRTRGVPLLVREYATAGGAPEDADSRGEHGGAREVVAARLDAASAATRQLVGAAVVIGTVADPDLLRATCGRDEAETVDAIEEAILRGLLVERTDRPGYDVPHDLVREATLARLSLARSRLLHGRVADVLARRHGLDPLATPAGAVARHLEAAAREAEAAAWFLVAAEESSRVAAHVEALIHLRAALALGRDPLEVHQAIGLALVRLGRYGEALVSLDQAAALAEVDPVRQAAIEHAIAGVHDRLGDWALAQAHLEGARDLVTDQPGQRRARILADLALVQHRQGRAAEARALASEAAAEAGATHDDAALAQAANVLGMLAAAEGSHAEALEHLTEAVAQSRRLGDPDLLIAALNNLARAVAGSGDDETALAAVREALELAERQGDRHRLAALHSHLADLLHAAGREDEALAALKRSAASFAQVHGSGARPEVWMLTEW